MLKSCYKLNQQELEKSKTLPGAITLKLNVNMLLYYHLFVEMAVILKMTLSGFKLFLQGATASFNRCVK